ncbi:SETMR methyltransferase, partial [Acromyrmex charruanus]
IETAFESHILTSAVKNFKHIESRRFFEDASEIVLEHVHSVMQRYDSIKINTVFVKFETLNDISINVYTNEKGIVPIRLADQKRIKHVNLLYVEDDNAGYLALIKDLSRLVRSQITRNKNKKYFCDSNNSKKLDWVPHELSVKNMMDRINICDTLLKRNKIEPFLKRMITDDEKWITYDNRTRKRSWIKEGEKGIQKPGLMMKKVMCVWSEDDKWLSFDNHCRKERISFVIYADLECALEKTDGNSESATYKYHHVSDTTQQRMHCSCDSSLSGYHFRREKEYIAWFTEELRNLAHNSSRREGVGYDAHFVIKEIAIVYERHVDLLPITKEKYISFTKHVDSTKNDQKNCVKLQFIDLFRFLASNLDKLALIYLKTDVLLLADVFKNFHDSCIDPAYYYILPGFTWDAMLKHAEVR